MRSTATIQSASSGGPPGADHQPPPPPPPPPPPDEPPPPDPLDEPGAVEAELTVLASDEPTESTKPPVSFQGLEEPEYQANPWVAPGAAAAAAKRPVTLDELSAQLEAASPALAGTVRDESTWTKIRRELSSLFVVRRAPVPSASPASRVARAQLMLARGKIGDAIAEVERLPGADSVQPWIEAAQRYEATQRALDLIETAAMLEPRALRDGTGKAVEQPSPLAAPADTPPAPEPTT